MRLYRINIYFTHTHKCYSTVPYLMKCEYYKPQSQLPKNIDNTTQNPKIYILNLTKVVLSAYIKHTLPPGE